VSKTAQIPLAPKLLPVFNGDARYRVAHGGRGSSKTMGFATMMAVDGYRLGRSGVSGVLLCAREHLVNLDESSMEEVKAAIRAVPWLDAYYEIGEKFIRSKDRRISFAFTGLRTNLSGVKSKAKILRAWVDEAEPVAEKAWSTLLPTVRAQGDWWQSEIWVTYNPEQESSATNQRFRIKTPAAAKVTELNWRDNPWFPEVLNAERLEDKAKRPETYEHVWEGAYLEITDAQIFANKFEMEAFEPEAHWNGPYHGMDFGFSQDENAATQSFIYDNTLYIRRESYAKKLEINHIAGRVAQDIPRIAMYTIRCDNARPETISYLRNHGLPQAVAVKKGKGSVEDGVEFIKKFDRIVIHPDCPNTHREFRLYSYKVDRLSGDILPVIVDANNHLIDSLRYALEPLIRFKAEPRIRSL